MVADCTLIPRVHIRFRFRDDENGNLRACRSSSELDETTPGKSTPKSC